MNPSRSRATAAIAAFVLVISVPAAFASHDGNTGVVGEFEVDGNFTFDSLAGATRDWENVGDVTRATDLFDSDLDDVFGGGAKEEAPDDWTFTVGPKPPGKDDLTRAYFASDVFGTQAFLWMAFERIDIQGQGNAHADFEVNQLGTTIVNGAGEEIPERSDGDILAVFDYAGGTNPVTLEVLEWDGIDDDLLTPENENALFGSWVDADPPPSTAFADINGAAITRPDLPGDDAFGGGSVGPKRFGEVGLDATGIFGEGFVGCPGFASFWAKTRASSSIAAQLKDKVGPVQIDFSTCGSVTVLKEDDAGTALDGATFELWRDNGDDTFDPLLDTLEATCETGEEAIAGQCTFEVVEPDDYFVREIAAPDGYVLDPTVSFVTVGQLEDVIVPHTYVDPRLQYTLALTPQEDTNLVDSDHVFEAHLQVSTDGGSTFSDAADEEIELTLAGSGAITAVSPAGTIAGDGKSATCTTGSDGTCSITIHSDDEGDSTLSAHFQKSTVNTPITADDDALKHWVNYRISVTPDGNTNLVDADHTFTVTVERTTDGTTFSPVEGASVDVAIASGPGAIASETCSSPGTDADGRCTVTISSSDPGQTTLSASYEAVEGDSSATFSTEADKFWVDYRVTVDPPSEENEVGNPHTFTVTVEQDTGGGFEPLPGVTVDLDWSGPVGSSITGGTCVSGVTDSNGRCTVTVSSATTGTGTLTATFNTALDSGPASRADGGTKTWVNFELTVTPGSARNEVGDDHVFTVTLTRDDGTGFTGFEGETVTLTLDPDGTDATIKAIDEGTVDPGGLSGTCTTDADGECSVTISSSEAGTVVLDAEWNGTVGNSTASREAEATKTYIAVSVSKSSCPEGIAVPGQIVGYTLSFTVEGDSIENAVLTDDLPAEVQFVGATGGGTHDGTDPNGTVTWTLGTLAPGTYSVEVTVQVLPTVAPGTEFTNEVSLVADGIAPKTDELTLTASNEGADAAGRAYGISFSLLGGTLTQAPTPDTDATNPGELTEIDVPGLLHDDVLNVINTASIGGTEATDTAIATTNALELTLPGVTVSASTIVARVESTASGTSAGSSRAGSKVEDLVVNGTTYPDLTAPKTIAVKDPLSGALIAEVRVLETTTTGAAAGVPQPDGGLFASGMTVNGIHVILHDLPTPLIDESSDVVIAHADGHATFPNGLACGESIPAVFGDAFVAHLPNPTPDAGSVLVGDVHLPITGGADDAAVADTTPLGTVTGSAHTDGTLDPLLASSNAETNGLDLLGGTITATTVRAESGTAAGVSSGDAIIEDLVIAGTDVCDALELEATCEPDPDTVLVLDAANVIVLLNEQITTGGGLRVNAVHIFVVGDGNPLGLPAGAELIVSSAFTNTS